MATTIYPNAAAAAAAAVMATYKTKNAMKSSLMVAVLITSGLFFGIFINFNSSNNYYVFAQSSVAKLGNLVSDINSSIIYNNYENSQYGFSIKYPSNMLIDESQSNETLKIVSFFPADPESSSYPDTFLMGFDVFVEKLDPLAYPSNTSLSTYLENQMNLIQSSNEDVTVIDSNTGAILSGHSAYKLVTKSYDENNNAIIDIEIGTILGSKLYAINYQVNSSDYENSIPVINKITSSFKILPKFNFNPFQILSNSSNMSELKNQIPLLSDIFSFFKTNKSSAVSMNSSIINSINNIFKNTTSQIKSSSSLPLSNTVIEKLCVLPILSKLCEIGGEGVGINNGLSSLPNSLLGLGSLSNYGHNNTNNNNNTNGFVNGLMMSVLSMMNPSSLNSNENQSNLNLSNLNELASPFGLFSSPPSSTSPSTQNTTQLQESMDFMSNLFANNSSSGLKHDNNFFGFLSELNKLK